MNYGEFKKVAFREIEKRLKEGRYTKKSEIDYFLFMNFGLGITLSDRYIMMLQDLGKISIDDDGIIKWIQQDAKD